MPPRYDVDLSHFPIVQTWLSDDQDLVELGRMIDRYYDLVLERGRPYVSVVDAREVYGLPSAKARRVIADARRRASSLGAERLILGICVISGSRFLRSTLSVVEWLSPLTRTTTVVGTPEEAFAWAHALIARTRGESKGT